MRSNDADVGLVTNDYFVRSGSYPVSSSLSEALVE